MIKSFLIATLSAFSISAQAVDVNISTGGEDGGYWRVGSYIKGSIDDLAQEEDFEMTSKVISSGGSVENLERFNEGDADIIVTQEDAMNLVKPSRPFGFTESHTETIFWIFNKENGYEDLEDIEKNEDVAMVLVEGSGATVTMNSFVQSDSGYEVNLKNAIIVGDSYEAAMTVANGRYGSKKVAGMLYVGAYVPTKIYKHFGNKLMVGSATDGDFNDAENAFGEPLYQHCEVTSKIATGLKTSGWGDPDTLCVKALVVYSNTFESKTHKKVVTRGVNSALSQITQ